MVIKVLAVVAGDFLAPSLLSCLDDGRGTRRTRKGGRERRGKEGGAALHFRAYFSYFCIRVLGTEQHINLR